MRSLVLAVLFAFAFAGAASASVYDDFKKGQDAANRKQNAQAIEIFTQVIDSKKLGGEWLAYAHYYRGQAYRRTKKYELAIADLIKAGELLPNFPGSYFEKALALHGQQDYKDAIAAFDKAIELKPGDADYYYSRCVTKSWANDTGGAQEDCRKAVDINDDYVQAWQLLGRTYEDQRNCAKAEEIYQKVLKMDPGNKSATEGLAYIRDLRDPKMEGPKCAK